ncbi:SUMF1/EgtB/PvdO family nonheme iron enzyme [Leptothoe sp. EHU-05/26/07-4]
MIRIFLAHASEDKEAVTHLYQCLKARGFQPWLDKVDLLPGQNWRAEIPKAIEASDVFLACLSQQSIQKRGYIQREFRMALNAMADRPPGQIFLIPVRFDDCQIPELRQEEYGLNLRNYQWVDLFEPNGFERLTNAIGKSFSATSKSITNTSFSAQLGSGVTLDMVHVPEGRFLMGSPKNEANRKDSEGPQHKVHVFAFYIGKHPVTQRQWREIALMNSVTRELELDPSYIKGDDLPVGQVNCYDAIEYCMRLEKHTGHKYRLPSEAEWEYACRAGTTTSFYFGDSITQAQVNYASSKKTPVGSYPANGFGLYDMHGNVWEWCLDSWHNNYENAPVDGSAWLRDDLREQVLRGGSQINAPECCRSASRYGTHPYERDETFGFRVVCSQFRVS